MKTRVDRRFADEANRFAFRFACEDCVHFEATESRCSLGYPAAPRRADLTAPHLELCKTFELY